MLRVVIDPGVPISAIITPVGAPAELLGAVRDGRLDIIVSPQLLAELAAVLGRDKFRPYLTLDEVTEFVEGLGVLGEAVTDVADPPRISRDPADDYLVALAQAAGAVAIVSGDADLLSLVAAGVSVVTPRELVRSLD